jgi:hypothetical protein
MEGLSFLANSPVETPSMASPPIIKGIPTEKLIYSPPIAPVNNPAHGPARMPLMNIGSCVKCILEGNGPAAMGITNGSIDRTFDKAAIKAANVNIFALLKVKPL